MRHVTQCEQDRLLLKQSNARIYFNSCVFRKAHNMRIRALYSHRLKSEIARIA